MRSKRVTSLTSVSFTAAMRAAANLARRVKSLRPRSESPRKEQQRPRFLYDSTRLPTMVCPLRIVVAAASIVVLAVSALWLLFKRDDEEDDVAVFSGGDASAAPPVSRPPRKLWRSFAALFTGEVLYEAYHRWRRPQPSSSSHAKAS